MRVILALVMFFQIISAQLLCAPDEVWVATISSTGHKIDYCEKKDKWEKEHKAWQKKNRELQKKYRELEKQQKN